VSDAGELKRHLAGAQADLVVFVRRHAGRLLRFETEEDLVQGIHARALERGGSYRHRGREQFLAWMYSVARTHLADRHHYWGAMRRRPSSLLRLVGDGSTGVGTPEPAASVTGPSTFAARRELVSLVAQALSLLREQDRNLVRWLGDGVPVKEQASRLGLSPDAAESASRRALERFRKAYRLVAPGI
jgi:RNA polymerase sigma factor (sigma-70 family)